MGRLEPRDRNKKHEASLELSLMGFQCSVGSVSKN